MQTSPRRRAPHEVESIAVLPFGSDCDEPDIPFLEQQIALRLINAVSKGSALRVLAYTTVKHYRAAVANPQAFGRDLGVQAVLVGEIVRRNGDALICIELIDVTDGAQLRGMQLKENWPKIIERGEQIAEGISQELTPVLSSSAGVNLERVSVRARVMK
jgi:TolB-like protein